MSHIYREYRTVDDLEINKEPGIMRYTPHPWTEFIPEESYGNPEEVFLLMPNTPVLVCNSITYINGLGFNYENEK